MHTHAHMQKTSGQSYSAEFKLNVEIPSFIYMYLQLETTESVIEKLLVVAKIDC